MSETKFPDIIRTGRPDLRNVPLGHILIPVKDESPKFASSI